MRLPPSLVVATLLAGLPVLSGCERPAPAAPSETLAQARQEMRAACRGGNTDTAACEAARRKLQAARDPGRGERGMLRMGTRLGLHALRMNRRGGF